METAYKTVQKQAQAEYIDRRSRFIGAVSSVTDEQEALAFIAMRKKEYWDAKHNVYAYCLRNGICRFSDDNEPQGTAGMPVLEVLQKQGLVDCVAVVTRYFGGILLGTGGLVRAYSQSTALAIAEAGIAEHRLCVYGELCCDYAQYGRLQTLFAEQGCVIDDTVFADDVTVRLHLEIEKCDRFCHNLTEISCGTVDFSKREEKFDVFLKK
ncbi:MAG: YigZ family protein [Clostridia bacterium]|nr:YigZ family protein [Clostridia bacterium]